MLGLTCCAVFALFFFLRGTRIFAAAGCGFVELFFDFVAANGGKASSYVTVVLAGDCSVEGVVSMKPEESVSVSFSR